MTNFINPKKEYLAGLTGMGGGPAGLALRSAAAGKTYVEDVFSTYCYIGNCASNGNGSTQNLTTGLDMTEGGLVWIKDRGNATDHRLVDTERGNTKELKSNDISADAAQTGLDAFLSNGITIGDHTDYNNDTNKYVAWNFRSAPGFFDVVKFTGSGVDHGSARAISHNLGCKPGMMICKNIDNASGVWIVYHKHVTAGGQDAEDSYMLLSETNAESTIQSWGNTAPTADNFYVAGAGGDYGLDTSGDEYICYLFADGSETDAQIFGDDEDEEIIKVGTYTGTEGNTNPFVDLGWEPQYVLMKKKESGSTQRDWVIADDRRGVSCGDVSPAGSGTNTKDKVIYANTTAAESEIRAISLESTGFSLMSDEQTNDNTYDYLYLAIRRPDSKVGKVKIDTATDVFAMDFGNGSSTGPNFDASFAPDLTIDYSDTDSGRWSCRKFPFWSYYGWHNSAITNTEVDLSHSKGYESSSSKDSDFISYMWKRFPEFFDVVYYKGNSSGRTIAHGLGVTPKMIWFRNIARDSLNAVAYIDPSIGGDNNKAWRTDDSGSNTGDQFFNNTSATSTVFSVNSSDSTNENNKAMIAFLFGEKAGLSKFGSYSGTNPGGGDTTIDCGFQPRWLLIHRLNGNGSWYVFDTLRDSFNASDRRYWMMELNYAEQQPDNQWVSLTASGFKIEDNSSNDINESGMTLMYYAIA